MHALTLIALLAARWVDRPGGPGTAWTAGKARDLSTTHPARGWLESLALLLALAAVKVFFSDTAHLDNLYRVLSFLGLGASLLVLGFVYQRFVFRAKPPDP